MKKLIIALAATPAGAQTYQQYGAPQYQPNQYGTGQGRNAYGDYDPNRTLVHPYVPPPPPQDPTAVPNCPAC